MEKGNFARQTEPKNWKRRRCPRCKMLVPLTGYISGHGYCRECENQIKELIDQFIYDAF